MKKFNYIFLFLLLGFLGKTVALPSKHSLGASINKESKLEKSKKYSEIIITSGTAKFHKQKRPKKPKGIQVIVLNLSNIVFHKFYRFSDFTINEVKGTYSLVLHYSHGKRGPPSRLIQE